MERPGAIAELLHHPCPRCTKAVLPQAQFCPRCGMHLQAPPIAPIAVPIAVPIAAPPPPIPTAPAPMLSYLAPQPRPCKEARDALTYAIIGIFCFGIVFEPIAIYKALKAKTLMRENPELTGAGKANAALYLAIGILAFHSLGFLAHLMR